MVFGPEIPQVELVRGISAPGSCLFLFFFLFGGEGVLVASAPRLSAGAALRTGRGRGESVRLRRQPKPAAQKRTAAARPRGCGLPGPEEQIPRCPAASPFFLFFFGEPGRERSRFFSPGGGQKEVLPGGGCQRDRQRLGHLNGCGHLAAWIF